MLHVQDAMDRIYSHGGVFIVFATARFDPQCITNALDRFGDLDPYGSRPLGADNWCLLSELRWLSVTADIGREMDGAQSSVARALGIENYFNDGSFECVVKPTSSITSQWITLATSKYGDPVAGIIVAGQEHQQAAGMIFIFPQAEHRAELVTELVDRVLPALRPRLFPHAEGSHWTRRPEDDLPRISALKNEIIKIYRRRLRRWEGAGSGSGGDDARCNAPGTGQGFAARDPVLRSGSGRAAHGAVSRRGARRSRSPEVRVVAF